MIPTMLLAADKAHPLYDTLVTLHVLSAVIGFGAVAISGVYGASASHQGRGDAGEETSRYFRSSGRAEWLVLLVPFLGAAALGSRPGGGGFSATWVVAAELVWLTAAGLLLGVIRPAERRIRAALRPVPDPPEGAVPAGVEAAGRRLMWAATACDVLFVAAFLLMVYQPP
jgi:hypothetical protein